MSLLTEEIKSFIGMKTEEEVSCEPVEAGAVRRFCQAIMDEHSIYYFHEATEDTRYEGPVAPPLFPAYAFRRPFGTPDPVQERADDPEFDGIVGSTAQGLPPLPLPNLALLNGGSEVEFYRLARHGERIHATHKYHDIYEKEGRNGPMVFVTIQTDYTNDASDLLLRVRKTLIRR
jgi:hypothetical protein